MNREVKLSLPRAPVPHGCGVKELLLLPLFCRSHHHLCACSQLIMLSRGWDLVLGCDPLPGVMGCSTQ